MSMGTCIGMTSVSISRHSGKGHKYSAEVEDNPEELRFSSVSTLELKRELVKLPTSSSVELSYCLYLHPWVELHTPQLVLTAGTPDSVESSKSIVCFSKRRLKNDSRE